VFATRSQNEKEGLSKKHSRLTLKKTENETSVGHVEIERILKTKLPH
jgi:hypothetical protein